MSYVLMGFVVDIAKVNSLVGSKNAALVEEIKEHNPDEFDAEEEEEDEEDEEDELSLSAALRQLIMAEPMDPEEAHQYGYALREICGYCGELQPCDAWGGVRWEAVVECGLEPLLTKSGSPVPLPPINDFPTIGHIRRGEIGSHLQAATELAEKSSSTDTQELLEEYIGWLETAQEAGLDLVCFYS